jgi:hypothetical protein
MLHVRLLWRLRLENCVALQYTMSCPFDTATENFSLTVSLTNYDDFNNCD